MRADVVELLRARLRGGIGQSPEVNPFWREQLEPLSGVIDGDKTFRTTIGYYDARLPNRVVNADHQHWPSLMGAVLDQDASHLDPAMREHAAQLLFLKRKGLLEDYVSWADERRLQSNMNLGRFFWYRHKLARQVQPMDAYLEVGAGSGRFLLMLAELNLARHYVIVDLPEMLLNAALVIQAERPDLKMRLDASPVLSQKPGVWLLSTSNIALVPAQSVGLAVNINSFMEMDDGVRDGYIGDIYRTLQPGGTFFNVNRRQQRMTRLDGSTFDSNPLLYPYRADDEVIEWEVDECQMTCKSDRFFTPPSWAISRTSRRPPAPSPSPAEL